MYDPALYRRTLTNVEKDQPDFYVTMGDDFSVDPLIGRGQLTQQNVDQLYIEMADFYEWRGKNRNGASEFAARRPGWELPIHQLMVKHGVTIFFQGHDHLFARQEKDGIIYQEVPNPADATYQVFNREAYRSGDILPNSGHLRVTVAPDQVKVEYVRSYLPGDEKPDARSGAVAFSYTVKPRARQ